MRLLNFQTHKKLKITGLVVLLLVIAAVTVFWHEQRPLLSYDPAKVPPITASPMDVKDVYQISQFRSNQGHDYSDMSWDGETCRSMKNYFNFAMAYGSNNVPIHSEATASDPDKPIYAPLDGTITTNRNDDLAIGKQVHIAAAANPSFYVVLFHIYLLPNLHVGSKVKSGQQIGTIGPKDGTDVAYEGFMWNFKTVYMSIFDHMTKQAFAPYAAMGFKPSDFVLTRAQADAKHYTCNGEQFTNTGNQLLSNNIPGVVSLRPNPYLDGYLRDHHFGNGGPGPQQIINSN